MKKLLLLALLLPTPLMAQGRTVVSGYLATDGSLPDNPLLVGLTASREKGILAGRLSAGFDMTDPEPVGDALAPAPVTAGIWSTDADALLFLGDPSSGKTLIPYAMAGVGLRGYQTDGRLGAAPNYSYGAGIRTPLGAGIAMEGELRRREILTAMDSRTPDARSGMEIRFGFSLGFGAVAAPRVRGIPAAAPVRGPIGSAAPPARVVAMTLNTAEQYLGIPYLWGGNTPQEGFDCSGFVRYVYGLNGISLPRVSRDQAQTGQALPLDVRSFEAGDLLAFASGGSTVDHIAIYVGNGRIIHSSSSGHGVRYDDLFSSRGKWYLDHMVAARRIVGGPLYAGAMSR